MDVPIQHERDSMCACVCVCVCGWQTIVRIVFLLGSIIVIILRPSSKDVTVSAVQENIETLLCLFCWMSFKRKCKHVWNANNVYMQNVHVSLHNSCMYVCGLGFDVGLPCEGQVNIKVGQLLSFNVPLLFSLFHILYFLLSLSYCPFSPPCTSLLELSNINAPSAEL